MDLSLTLNPGGAKPFLAGGLTTRRRQPPKAVGISCMATKATSKTESNLYKMLSLASNNAGIDEIKRAYRAMALKYHPDVCRPEMKEECSRMFVQLHEAYKTLLDPVSREEYDLRLSLGDFARTNQRDDGNDRFDREIWQGQIVELRRRSSCWAEQKEGSWGSRLRARNRGNGAM